MKRLIAVVICLTMCLSMATPVLAAGAKLPFEPGKEGTFFAPTFSNAPPGYEDIVDRFILDRDQLEELGPKAYAQQAATKLSTLPKGRKCIQLHGNVANGINADQICGGMVCNPKAVEDTRVFVDSFFAELKALGAELDIVYDDLENWPSIWGFENQAIQAFMKPGEDIITSYTNNGHLYEPWIKKKLLEVEADPSYQSVLKPALVEAGYIFGEEYDLEYINIHPGAVEPRRSIFFEKERPEGAERAYLAIGGILGDLAEVEYNKAISEPIWKYYPDVKVSNYGSKGTSGQMDLYDFSGNLVNTVDGKYTENILGSHSNTSNYGFYGGSMNKWIEDRVPRVWRFKRFEMNAFNQLKMNYSSSVDAAASSKAFSAWISNRSYGYSGTSYYTELIYHLGMLNPDPFLFYTGNTRNIGEELKFLEDLFGQLDTLVGHDDRKTLMDHGKYASTYDDRYVLSGIYAGGKNVWRITPDLFTPGATMENFLVDEKTPAFRIGNQNVEFPKGSYIYYPENDPSEYGYWVISPEGTRPREWRDDKHPMPGEPVPMGDGIPTGYKYEAAKEMPDELDLSRSKDRLGVKPVDPKGDEVEGGDVTPPVDTDVVVQTLNLNPIREFKVESPIKLELLPKDVFGHWAEHTLANMFALGVMQGSDEGMMPDDEIETAEFLAMLQRILGAETIEYTGDISDVAAESWYATVMQTAVSGGWIEKDIVSGAVYPESGITRGQICSILAKALSLKEADNVEFKDSALMSVKVRDNVGRVASIGLIEGYEDGSFRPGDVLTRAETATIFERLLKEIPTFFAEEEE